MKPYVLDDHITLVENAIFLKKSKTLVISDLQIGQEQQLRRLGHNIVYEQMEGMRRLLRKLILQTKAKRLVINGDLKHEFGRITGQERRDIPDLLTGLGVEIIIVKGNHDTITAPIAKDLGIPFVDSWSDGGILCIHGHREPAKDILKGVTTIIIGHMHPAVGLTDGVRKERVKCFLVARYERKRLIVLPSFSTLVDGTDVLSGSSNSPLVSSLEKAEVYALADEIRKFGDVEGLRRIL